MNNTPTWLLLTDGYFIRIMIKKDTGSGLRTLRDGDFEHTSEITYNLVTGKRNQKLSTDEETYFLESLGIFLSEQHQKQSFESLVLIAPDKVLKKLLDYLPEAIRNTVTATLAKDYLAETQDKLERYLENIINA